jgi:hypothetical protein
MFSSLFKDIIDALIKWWKRIWFEAKLKATLDMIELDNRIQAELELEKQNKPIYTEHPINPVLQTGESQKLGGAIQLTAPWYEDEQARKSKAPCLGCGVPDGCGNEGGCFAGLPEANETIRKD